MSLCFGRGYRVDFQNARLWRANLEGASLSEADFRGVNLREGILRSAKLDRLQAAKSNLVSVHARWANFSCADFRDPDLPFTTIEVPTFTTPNLTPPSFYPTHSL